MCVPVSAINSFSWLIQPLTQLKTQIQHNVNEQGFTHHAGQNLPTGHRSYWAHPQEHKVLGSLNKSYRLIECMVPVLISRRIGKATRREDGGDEKGEDEGKENNKINQKETKWKKATGWLGVARPGSYLFSLTSHNSLPRVFWNFLKSAHSTSHPGVLNLSSSSSLLPSSSNKCLGLNSPLGKPVSSLQDLCTLQSCIFMFINIFSLFTMALITTCINT